MSLFDLIFSRQEVVISLAFAGLLMVTAFMLIVVPAISRSWKKAAMQRKTRKAAKAAKAAPHKKSSAKKQAARRRPVPEAPETPEVVETPPVPIVAVVSAPPAPAPEEMAEQIPAETEDVSDMQNILDSVFVDEEANLRYEKLMGDIEVLNIEELLALAKKIASDLQKPA